MHKYRIFCETDGWQECISDNEISSCPVDGGHSVRANSVSIIEKNISALDGTPEILSLASKAQLTIISIVSKTEELKAAGFPHDLKTFNTDDDAWRLFTTVAATKNQLALPLKAITKDRIIYLCNTLAEVDAILQSWVDYVQPIMAEHFQLIADATAAGDQATLDNISATNGAR